MTQAEVNKLDHGLYIVHWRRGGTSLAAVGGMEDGTRWLAPCNWALPTTTNVESVKAWRDVESVTEINQMLLSKHKSSVAQRGDNDIYYSNDGRGPGLGFIACDFGDYMLFDYKNSETQKTWRSITLSKNAFLSSGWKKRK